MDDLNCDGEVLRQTLTELEVINRLLGGNHVTLDAIKKVILKSLTKKWKIVDLGCGGGDMLVLVKKWLLSKNIEFELIGIDANPNVIEFARKNCKSHPEITFETQNIFSEKFSNESYDIVIGTLFYHHFTDTQLVSTFKSLKSQAEHIIFNDIHRHPLAYYSIKLLTTLLSKSEMVKFDAPLSVLRAFRREELEDILEEAGISEFNLRWKWAFRWQLIF